MATIVTRAGKGSRLTTVEMDANLNNLNNDKLEVATAASTYQPLDADLTAISALATTGYAKRTGVGTWAISATVAGSDITGAIDSVTVGLTTPAAARFTSLLVNAASFLASEKVRVTGDVVISGVLGFFGPIVATNIITIGPGTHPSGSVTLAGISSSITAPSTATNLYNYMSDAGSTAAVYTLARIGHFLANSTTVGAGSTVGTVYGFRASAGIAVGSLNYAFYSDLSAAAGSWQLMMAGTAKSSFLGPVSIGTSGFSGGEAFRVVGSAKFDNGVDILGPLTAASASTGYIDNIVVGQTTPAGGLFSYVIGGHYVGGGPYLNEGSIFARQPPTNVSTVMCGFKASLTGPTTATDTVAGVRSSLASTAAAYTLTNAIHFHAVSTSKGAGSTITNSYGFLVADSSSVATNQFGYGSAIVAGANNYGLYFSGTAKNYLNGEVGIKASPSVNVALTLATPTGTGTTIWGAYTSLTGPTTATSNVIGYDSNLATSAAAYVTTNVIHFQATQTTKGAGSTITASYGFVASNNIAVGTSNYGFYSSIASAAATYQLFLTGTAQSYFGGNVVMLNGTTFGWGTAGVPDTMLERASAGIIEQKNGASAQTYRIYGTTTGPKYLSLAHDGTNAVIDVSSASGRLSLGGNATSIFGLSHLLFTDNTFDIGASGATRPRSGYFSTTVFAPNFGTTAAGNIAFFSNTSTQQFGILHVASANRYITVAGSNGGNPAITATGGCITVGVGMAKTQVTVTYSASMTPDASLGNNFVITIPGAVAHTINAPTNPTTGQEISFTLRNASGGVAGAATWNAVFKMVAWTQPANGFSRTIYFLYNGTNWVEVGRTAADVAN